MPIWIRSNVMPISSMDKCWQSIYWSRISKSKGPINENDPSIEQEKAEGQKKESYDISIEARFTTLNDELSDDLSKMDNRYPNGIAEAMQLAQNYRTDGKAIWDLMIQGVHHETYDRVSTGEKNYDRKRKGEWYWWW